MNVIFAGQQFQKITYVENHAHDCYEIIMVTSGECYIFIEGEKYYIQKDSVIILPPGTYHGNISDEGFTDLFIHVDKIMAIQGKPFVFLDKSEMVRNLGHSIFTTWIQKDYNHKAIISALLTAINEYIIKYKGETCLHDFVQELKTIIAAEFSNAEFKLTEKIAEIGISPDYMRHMFKEEMGMTPLEYLTDLRIQKAKYFLAQNRHMNIEQISFDCGFKDPYYFSRCFKKKTGISPREYRHQKSV